MLLTYVSTAVMLAHLRVYDVERVFDTYHSTRSIQNSLLHLPIHRAEIADKILRNSGDIAFRTAGECLEDRDNPALSYDVLSQEFWTAFDQPGDSDTPGDR